MRGLVFVLAMGLLGSPLKAQESCDTRDCRTIDESGKAWNNSRVIAQPGGLPPSSEVLGSGNPSRSNACVAAEAKSTSPFRISIDGEPFGNAPANAADSERCVDQSLAEAEIQVRFDGLQAEPVLNVVAVGDAATRGGTVTFRPYSNYRAFIHKAELRVFDGPASSTREPYAVVPLPALDQALRWSVPADANSDRLYYLLRVYDEQGRFDETAARPLALVDRLRPAQEAESEKREQLIGYGENHLALRNIPVRGGSVTVNGSDLREGTRVEVLGESVPVGANGRFALRQILPPGAHRVRIITEQSDGARAEFERRVYIPDDDWFYIALADLTIGRNNVSGPASLVTQDDSDRYREKVFIDGRLAFYLKGKIKGEYLLTASADTREGPVEELLRDFHKKDARSLLRRVDPNAYYPVYGDDSTLTEDAPTQGKLYVKLARGDSHVLWGNFNTQLGGNELVSYRRALYGAQARYRSEQATPSGERRMEVEVFAADPGTLAAIDEFRGTGGSLYYLRNQDVVAGSERLRVEVRDRDSGLVISSEPLVFGEDYEINYTQGRVVLIRPLGSTADDDNGLVRSGSLSGNPAWLVADYEYIPDVSNLGKLTTGGRAQAWVNEHLRVGVTGYRQEGDSNWQNIAGADIMLRRDPGTWLKLERAASEGPGSGAMSSQNAGFDFSAVPQTRNDTIDAKAYRIEGAIDLKAMGWSEQPGSLYAYRQEREDGYSAPGQLTSEGLEQTGIRLETELNERLSLSARLDDKLGERSGRTRSAEMDAEYAFHPGWSAGVGVRHDDRESAVAGGNSAVLADSGSRTDVATRLTHRPAAEDGEPGPWAVYGLAQATVARDGGREDNNRYGLGGSYRINDRLQLKGEATDGSGGLGGLLGVDYQYSDRSSVYLNYQVDTDRSDIGYRGRSSSLTVGSRTRIDDSLSVYAEERQHERDDGQSGLIHAFGLDLAASDRWTWGARLEHGTTSDPANGDLDRTAVSLSGDYRHEKTRYGSTLEYRTEQGNTTGKRDSWLWKNTLGYQVSADWRFLGRLNLARSDAGEGSTTDADYTELVAGYAYRPVDNDGLNVLFKYTYLSDLASPGQVSSSGLGNPYEQRSHVLAADAIYDLTPRWSIGGKIGYRRSEVRDTSAGPGPWFDSNAWLAIARLDWHVVHEWDLTLELRRLDVEEARDSREGALVAVYRHIDDNLKLGAGYNFTDFSDDLTDLDYSSRGWFINVLAKY